MTTTHQKIVNTTLAILASSEKMLSLDVLKIGEELEKQGGDQTNGGMWIWDIETGIEFYSKKFRKSLCFKGEEDFPSVAESWQNQISKEGLIEAFDNYAKHISQGGDHAYDQIVNYTTKDGKPLKVVCSGTVVKKDGKPYFLIGTHQILE